MSWLRREWILVLVAVLGIGGGITAARFANDPAQVTDPESINDPLKLGIPLVSRDCSGDAVIVLGTGDSAAELTFAVNNAPKGVRYLRTDESCDTKWASGPSKPEFVAYVGPFDDELKPCEDRMSGDTGPSAEVTNLTAGNTGFVPCGCIIPAADAPTLVPPDQLGEGESAPPAIWIAELQAMLNAFDDVNSNQAKPLPINGLYDQATIDRVIAFQSAAAIERPAESAEGTVDEATWSALESQVCAELVPS